MKRIFTFLVFLVTAHLCMAQYFIIPYPNAKKNPGGLNNDVEYPVGGGLPTGWKTILTAPSPTAKWSNVQTLPFTFKFGDSLVTKLKVSSSAVVTFNTASTAAAPGYENVSLPNASIPDQSICLLGISALGANDNVITKTFGVAPNRQFWIQFSSYSYGTTVPSDGSNYCYWSIVLEETSNSIYIVDNRSFGYKDANKVSAGLQIDATKAISVAGSPELVALSIGDPTPADNAYYSFNLGVQPALDIAAEGITTASYALKGDNVIEGSFKNYGTEKVTSFDFNYKINGEATVTENIKGLDISSFDTKVVAHPTKWNAKSGFYTVEVWASNINGKDDANLKNDKTSKKVNVLTKQVQRKPLLEVFTSSTCPPCKPGNTKLHGIIDTKPEEDYVVIKYQQDFPGTGDPYATVEAVNRRTTPYAVNAIPNMQIDGGWNENANAFTEELYTKALETFAQFNLEGRYYVDQASKTVTAKVNFSPLYGLPANSARLFVAVLENTTKKNVKSNGETEFLGVMKKMLPNEKGTLVKALGEETADTISLSYKFNGNYRLATNGQAANQIKLATEHSVEEFTDLKVIAWLQSTGTDKQVYQAFNLVEDKTIGANELPISVKNITTYPNPTTDVLNVSLKADKQDKITMLLISVDGKVTQAFDKNISEGTNVLQINTSDMPNGTYYLSIIDGANNSHTEPVVIMH